MIHQVQKICSSLNMHLGSEILLAIVWIETNNPKISDGSLNVVVEFLWLRGRLCCVCAGLWHFETKEVLTLVSAVESMWSKSGPVAQRIRHLTTNQGIAGSSPARITNFLFSRLFNVHLLHLNCRFPPEAGRVNFFILGWLIRDNIWK